MLPVLHTKMNKLREQQSYLGSEVRDDHQGSQGPGRASSRKGTMDKSQAEEQKGAGLGRQSSYSKFM